MISSYVQKIRIRPKPKEWVQLTCSNIAKLVEYSSK